MVVELRGEESNKEKKINVYKNGWDERTQIDVVERRIQGVICKKVKIAVDKMRSEKAAGPSVVKIQMILL